MRSEWVFRAGGDDVLVLERRAWHRVSAAQVASWLEEPTVRPQAIDMFLGIGAEAPAEAFGSGARVLSHLSGAFDHGGLVALRSPRTTPPVAAAVEPAEAPPPRRAAATSVETTWIAIALLDENGVPVAGEAYTIVLPDGTELAGRLDANGRARVDGIDPGTCRVSFPELGGGRR